MSHIKYRKRNDKLDLLFKDFKLKIVKYYFLIQPDAVNTVKLYLVQSKIIIVN